MRVQGHLDMNSYYKIRIIYLFCEEIGYNCRALGVGNSLMSNGSSVYINLHGDMSVN